MKNINIKLLGIIAVMGIIMFFLGKGYINQSKNYSRLEKSFIAANQEIQFYKSKNGQMIAKTSVLELKASEVGKIYPDVEKEEKNMKIKPGRMKIYSETGTEQQKEIKPPLTDTIIVIKHDTIKTKGFNYTDTWTRIKGIVLNDSMNVNYSSIDTVISILHKGDRIHPWLWIFSKRKIEQAILNKNPNTKIIYNRTIKIE